MHRFLHSICISFLIVTATAAHADETVKITTTGELVQAVISSHPDIKAMTARTDIYAAREKTASQVPNLEFDSRLLGNSSEGYTSSEYSLLHTFELGSKRKARKNYTSDITTTFQLSLALKKQEVARQIILDLYRMRQVTMEISTLKENAETYRSLVSRYSRLPRLNPELQVSRDIYSQARDDAMLRVKQLRGELLGLEKDITTAAGTHNIDFAALYPNPVERWPQLSRKSSLESPLLHLAGSKVTIQMGRKKLADSNAWPNLRIGPSIEHATAEGNTELNYGLSLSVTLPLYHQRQGQREEAAAAINLARVNKDSLEGTLKLARETALARYENFIDGIDKRPFPYKNDDSHRRLHRLVRRGLVSPALTIESHRQEYELLRSFHQNEMSALRNLWAVYYIDGVILKEIRDDGTR